MGDLTLVLRDGGRKAVPKPHSLQIFGPVAADDEIYGRAIADFTITDWQATSSDGTSGSAELDLWVSSSAKPTVSDSIVDGNYLAISSAASATGTSSGWSSTTIAKGDHFIFKVRSLTTITTLSVAAFGP